MIRHERVCSLLRMFNADAPHPFEPYDAIVTVLWEADPHTIWLQGFHGKVGPRIIWQLHAWLVAAGITTVKAHRADGHLLPGGVLGADGVTTIDIAAITRRRRERTRST